MRHALLGDVKSCLKLLTNKIVQSSVPLSSGPTMGIKTDEEQPKYRIKLVMKKRKRRSTETDEEEEVEVRSRTCSLRSPFTALDFGD